MNSVEYILKKSFLYTRNKKNKNNRKVSAQFKINTSY